MLPGKHQAIPLDDFSIYSLIGMFASSRVVRRLNEVAAYRESSHTSLSQYRVLCILPLRVSGPESQCNIPALRHSGFPIA